MVRFIALFLALALAACSSGPPPQKVVKAAGKGLPSAQPYPRAQSGGHRANAQRSIPRPSQYLVADYVLVDKSDRLLIAYANGKPIRAFRNIQFGDAPTGHKRFQGDERTPEGRYWIDWRNPQSRYHLSLRISYPNAADRAFAAQYGRSPGGDIFIHGQPNGLPMGRLPGDWTDGCIALTNSEIEELWQIVPNGTPIDIRP